MSLRELANELEEWQGEISALEKRGKKIMKGEPIPKSPLKTEIDKQLDDIERLLKAIEKDLKSCGRILNGQSTMLKRIGRLYRQPELELFKARKMQERTIKKVWDKIMNSLVETI